MSSLCEFATCFLLGCLTIALFKSSIAVMSVTARFQDTLLVMVIHLITVPRGYPLWALRTQPTFGEVWVKVYKIRSDMNL